MMMESRVWWVGTDGLAKLRPTLRLAAPEPAAPGDRTAAPVVEEPAAAVADGAAGALVAAGPLRTEIAADWLVAPDGTVAAPEDLADLAARTRDYARGARAAATHRAYASDWEHFARWCAGRALVALPAEPLVVGMYLVDCAHPAASTKAPKIATLVRRLSSIAVRHRGAGYAMDTRHPAIRDVMRRLRREIGVAQDHAAALTVPLLRRLLDTCGDRLIDARDRALLLVGFGAALRRSEVVALDYADIDVVDAGLRITIRKSKSDQEGEGQVIAVGRTGTATCPVAAYLDWLAAAKITEGAVFRCVSRHGHLGARLSGEAVADIVQRRAAAAGLPEPKSYKGHSLRAGFATSAASARVEERVIMRQTRHRSAATVRRYIREGELFERNLAAEVGL